MRRTITAAGALSLIAIVAVTGCRSDSRDAEIEATRARIAAEQTGAATVPPLPAGTPGAAQVGQNLAGFQLVFGSGDGTVGRFVRTGPDTWVGPDLTNYQPVTWSATTSDDRVLLTTASPPDQRLDVNVSNGQVSSAHLDPSLNYRMAGQVFQ